MKNRDRYIIKQNEADMLYRIQAAMSTGLCSCIIEAIEGKDRECKGKKLEDCWLCIRLWLNEEE